MRLWFGRPRNISSPPAGLAYREMVQGTATREQQAELAQHWGTVKAEVLGRCAWRLGGLLVGGLVVVLLWSYALGVAGEAVR